MTFEKNSVVLYKNQAAVVTGFENDKIIIKYCSSPKTPAGKKASYSEQKVRQKDVVLLCGEKCSSLENVLSYSENNVNEKLTEVYELLSSDGNFSDSFDFLEIAGFATDSFNADKSWFFFNALINSYEFSLVQDSVRGGFDEGIKFNLRTNEQIEEIKKKEYEKNHADEIKTEFIKRLKSKKLDMPSDAKFTGDIENFALCKTDKCKILSEAGFSQTLEKAHKLLIDCGIWDYTKNPYPSRFGFSFSSASEGLSKMPEEERLQINHTAFAIDNEYSTDPDDAVSFDGEYFWVHIADPASSVMPDSSIDIAARNRGTTLYIPEGASRMLCESCLEDYALGLKNPSKALSFRLKVDENAEILECSVFKTILNVERMTYKQAEEKKDSSELKPLFEIARKNIIKRESHGAVEIKMPEIHIFVQKETKKVFIEEDVHYEANIMVREMMLLAGEGAARFAFKNQIPFPYVSQESPDFPEKISEGFAGEFAKIKCMKRRSVGITPSVHSGVGLSFYSQVTSPLRRYGDLVAHQQLRAFMDKRRLLSKDEMLERIAAGDAASIAAKKASRLSETHWKLVFLMQNPEKTFEAVCIDNSRQNEVLFLIPFLDMQTTFKNQKFDLNQKIILKPVSIDIPNQKVEFIQVN